MKVYFLINKQNLILNLILLIIFIKNVNPEQEEFFTALSDMEKMITTESVLLQNLNNYLNAAEFKLNNLKKALTQHKEEFRNLSQNLNQTNEVIQSLALYKYLSKFNRNFYHLEDLVEEDLENAIIKNVTNAKENLTFPTTYDLNGAALGLARLQDIYNLTIDDFKSLLSSRPHNESKKLDFTDYYYIGLNLFNKGEFEQAEPWILESLKNFRNSSILQYYEKLTKSHLCDILSWIYHQQKDWHKAIEYTKKVIELEPNLEYAKNNLKTYEEEKQKLAGISSNHLVMTQEEFLKEALPRYKLGCRGELKRSVKFTSQLECWYLRETNNFLYYGPIKVEDLNYDPEMFIFHDIIYDSEIEKIKNLTKGNLIRAKVWDTASASEYKAEYRTNKLYWLENETIPVVTNVKQRIGAITGLSMKSSERLQVGNYGIAGHYEPHHDFYYISEETCQNSIPNFELGNRLATLVFYLSDVKSGGATVFPYLNITVFPQKGSALFWYNLFSTGAGDLRTFHAACPVLEGDKWILNQWIREREQEFNRPCNLERDDV